MLKIIHMSEPGIYSCQITVQMKKKSY